MTTIPQIPLPVGATPVTEWQVDGDHVFRFFYGSTHKVGDVTVGIPGHGAYSFVDSQFFIC